MELSLKEKRKNGEVWDIPENYVGSTPNLKAGFIVVYQKKKYEVLLDTYDWWFDYKNTIEKCSWFQRIKEIVD
jgi:hypothetical protein